MGLADRGSEATQGSLAIGNCGFSAAPVKAWYRQAYRRDGPMYSHTGYDWDWSTIAKYRQRLADARPAINVLTLVGHTVKAERSQAGAAAELMRLLHLELLTRGLKTFGLLAVSTVTTDTEIDRLSDTLFDVLDSFRPTIEAVLPTLLQPVSQPV
jgi:N-acyl-D-aspartate/D-glutamate deacylase